MKTKTVITLDPEYIPWEPGTPVVRLRRKRRKTLAAVVSLVLGVLVCGVIGVMGRQGAPATPEPSPTGEPVVAQVAATPGDIFPTPPLISRGKPGHLALVRGTVVMFYPCSSSFVVSRGEEVIASGEDTDSGPLIDVSVGEVRIECGDQTMDY